MAKDLMCRPVGGDILGYERDDGEIVRFNEATVEYVAGKPGGVLRTYMSPKYDDVNNCKNKEAALEYYLRRKKKDLMSKEENKKTKEQEEQSEKNMESRKDGKMENKNDKAFLCPVCGKYFFDRFGDDDVCEVCGWENDPIQYDNPDETRCCNRMSLNQAREAWKKGIKIV